VEPAERIASQKTVEPVAKGDVAVDEIMDEMPEEAAQGDTTSDVAQQPNPASGPASGLAADRTPASQPAMEMPAEHTPSSPSAMEVPAEKRVVSLPAGPEVAVQAGRPEEGLPTDQAAPAPLSSPPPGGIASEAPREAGSPPAAAYPDTGMPAIRPFVPEPVVPEEAASPPAAGAKAAERPAKRGEPVWPEPEMLLAELDGLTKHELTNPWAKEAIQRIARLGPAISKGGAEARSILDDLEMLGTRASSQVSGAQDRVVARQWGHAVHALQRRVAVWQQIDQMGGLAVADAHAPAADSKSMAQCLKEIDSLTRNSEEGNAWRKYLLLDNLRDWWSHRKSPQERLPGGLAQQLLRRLNQAQMTPTQRQFLTSGPLASLHKEVLRHASDPVDATRLLADLECYERTGLPSDAHLLADDCQYLDAGSSVVYRQLAGRVEQHYRNANLRLAISAELLNRLVPKRAAEYARVEDTVLGMPVRGQSLVASALAIRLLPDPAHVRLALEVSGEVSSSTSGTSGPATFVNDSEATYVARKPLEIDLQGITLWPTEVDVDHGSRLRQLRTDFDPVPLVGQFARGVARSQYQRRQPAANAEVQQKLVARVEERVDREATDRLTEFGHRLHENVLGPIEALLLDPTLVAAETTQQRAIMRVRLAGHDQLGSHTPRPQAPGDSFFSAQIHESLLNNVLGRLDLEGQTFTLAELEARIAERLHRPQPKACDPDQEDVKITFAAQNAVRLRCAEGRLEVTLAVAKLSKSPRHWKDFQVRAYYRPDIHGRSIELVRDGVVQLMGSRLTTGSQLALRGVFSKVFSQKSPWQVTPHALAANPNLQGLGFTQFALDDGWLSVALGPERTAARPAGLRR